MAYRTFVDPAGVTWQVWEVRPSTVERRMGERRSAVLPFEGRERRSGAERRYLAEQRVSLGPELSHGWLAFHSAREKRRLAPIPAGWAELSVAQLVELCAHAKPVSTHSGDGGGSSGGGSHTGTGGGDEGAQAGAAVTPPSSGRRKLSA